MRIFFILFAFSLHAKTVCLNMIVKDEAPVIERCLNSVKLFIDCWVIVDTGSTDGTQEIIRKCLCGIPGEFYERPWVDFEHNRNEALQLAKDKADYLLLLDADEELLFSEDFVKPSFDRDFYVINVEQSNGLKYQRPALIDAHLDWKWVGVLHEVIVSSEAKECALLEGVVNVSRTEEGARFRDPNKYLKDAQILEKALEKDPTNARYVFYLAQSYANAQEYLFALQNYQRRAAMGGWEEEIFWSLYCIGQLQKLLNDAEETVIQSFWRAFQYRPSRVEPLYELINYYLSKGNYPLGYILSSYALTLPVSTDVVFVDRRLYDYRLLAQFVDAAYFMGKREEAAQAVAKLLANPQLPEEERARLKGNLSVINN